MKLKQGDNIVVLSGKDKGKRGEILVAMPKSGKLIVSGVNVATKHQKPRSAQEQGGIIETETPIYVCKVQLICPKCGKATRVGYKIMDDGSKARVCKHCAEAI
ncbi:MAG: 50S ribosomal protein L24 [Oscillospiraceae bacterium]|jgi:large subunit ribosomal protein L24|nr:50S ribosomal protein L24 [Oscillospiraceae bacterium]